MLALHRHLDYEPPPPEGAEHFSWDANVQSLLEQVVQAINDKNLSTEDRIEVGLTDGSTVCEGVQNEILATRLIELLQDNGGLAPAWQVQALQAHAQVLQEQGASEAEVYRVGSQ